MTDHAELIRRLEKAACWADALGPQETGYVVLAQLLRDAASQLAAPAREPQTWQPVPICPHCGDEASDSPEADIILGTSELECAVCGVVVQVTRRTTNDYRVASAPSPSPTPEAQG